MKYDFKKISKRILNERKKIYVSRGKSNQYNRDKKGHIIYAHQHIAGYHRATQKDILNIASDLGLHIGRNSLSDLENGVKDASSLSLEEITALSTIFDCEAAYLLCEQPQPYRTIFDGMQATHLSADAVKILSETPAENKDTLDLLSFCISDDDGSYIQAIMEYFRQFLDNACEYREENDKRKLWEKDNNIMNCISYALYELRNDYFRDHPMESSKQKIDNTLSCWYIICGRN